MDSGDRPTCSKYYKEPEPEPEDEPDTPAPDQLEVERGDEASPPIHHEGEDEEENGLEEPSGWQLSLPSTILRETGDVLQLPEIKNLRLVCRSWTASLDAQFLQKSRRFAVNATSYQWEPIHYSHALYAPRLFPRMFHTGAHHPMTDKIYMFGGNGPQRRADCYDFDAHFNDVWTYDLRLKRWERLLVPGTPYPTPKSRASLVAWKEYLVLFGGFRRPNRRRGFLNLGAAEFPERTSSDEDDEAPEANLSMPDRGSLPHEIHYLDVRKNVWETATPVHREGGVNFLGLHDHSAAVFGKWMVVVGGQRSTPWEEELFVNQDIYLFDLEEKVWHKAPRPVMTFEERNNGPRMAEFARGTLALIRPGRFLFHPCFPIRTPPAPARPRPPPAYAILGMTPPGQPLPIQLLLARNRDALSCYFLDFDVDDMLGVPWRWRGVPVASPHVLRAVGPLAAPVAVTADDRVQLVNLVADTVRLRRDSDYDSFHELQSFSVNIKREIRARLAKYETPAEFYDSLARAPFEFELDCADFYKHLRPKATGEDALKLIVSVLQGRSGHIGDYKVSIRYLDARCEHLFTRGVTNFIEETTVGNLPTKGGGKSPHASSTEKTLQMVRQSGRRVIKILKADVTALDEKALPRLTWEETEERPRHEECPVPSAGLLLVQADGALFVTGGESRPDEEGLIDTSIGGGTWVANPMK